jgi:alginate O-acetyltransferase complex protein AlgI
MLTMVLGGLWHGANWTFLIWGAWHGGLLAAERYLRERYPNRHLPRVLAIPLTLFFVMVGWIFFKATSVTAALTMLKGLLGLSGFGMSPELAWQVVPERIYVMGLGIVLVFIFPWLRRRSDGALRLLLIPLFLWAVATLSSQAFTPFLYFQF